MSLSDYAENAIVDAICNNVALQVGQVYVKLHTGDPGEAGTSSPAGETTRKAASFGASAGGVGTSDADCTWNNVSTAETISHVSFWDHATAGNCLGSGALTAAKTVAVGDTFVIPSGSLTLTIT